MNSVDKTFNTICRICFSHGKPDEMVSLIDTSRASGLSIYGSIFEDITKIAVSQDQYFQYLPINLCQTCKDTLEVVSKFLLACDVSDKKLKKLIRFSLKQELDRAMVKEVIRQYSLFSQNFAENSSSIVESSPSQYDHGNSQKQVSTAKYPKMNVEIDVQPVNASDDLNTYNSDNQTGSQSDVDIFIDSIKKVIMTSSSDIKIEPTYIPKNETTTDDQDLSTLRKKIKLKKEQDLTCSVCHKVLATEKTFKHHIQRHGVCRFVCDQCGKGFPINAELVQHQIHSHGARSQYECDLCGYRAVKKIQLIEHMRLHTGERPFTCEKCGLTFRRKTLYNKHAKFHGERTIQCDFCPRMFFVRSAMLAHRNCHDREYVYPCRICNTTYKIVRTVKKHMLEKHGIPNHMQGKIQKILKTDASSDITVKSISEAEFMCL